MDMTTHRPNGIAPVPDGYAWGAKGGRVAQAWQAAWNALSPKTYAEGVKLAESVAAAHNLKPASVIAHFHRMAAAGVLETERRRVEVPVRRGNSTYTAHISRTFYRIKSER